MQREKRYLAKQKDLQRQLSKMGKLYLNLQTQADFPDSGYFYSRKEAELGRMVEMLEFRVKAKRWKKLWNHLIAKGNEMSYNYYEKVQVVDKNGRAWTAADMDAAMANG